MQQTRCTNCMKEIAPDMRYCPYCGYDQQAECQPSFLRQNTILRGRYLVGRVIGKGGFGITYVGFDLTLEMKVAIKEYYPSGIATRNNSWSNQVLWESIGQDARAQRADSMERVLKEARRTAKLANVPTVVRVNDAFCENETAYIVMDFIEGTTLKDYLKQHGVMTFEECEKLLFPVMEGLAAAHDIGIIHRDISPDNIMVQPDGTAKLLDLGAAVDVSLNDGHASTLVVKNHFSALEQYDENGQLGSWTDVYAFAAMLYYCMTGKVVPPVMDRVLSSRELAFPAQPEIPAYVKEVLTKALAIRQEDRIQDMRAFEKALAHVEEAGGEKVHTEGQWATQVPGQEQGQTRNSNLNQAQAQYMDQGQNQSMNQSHNQSMNQSHVQNMNQSHAQNMNQSHAQNMNQSHAQSLNPNPGQNLTWRQIQNSKQEQMQESKSEPNQIHEATSNKMPAKIEGGVEKTQANASTKKTPKSRKSIVAALCVVLVIGVCIFSLHPSESNSSSKASNSLGTTSSEQANPSCILSNPGDKVLAFNSEYKRSEIISITFLSTLENEPSDSWDVSEAGDGSVKAWVKAYHLYIAAEGGVIAPTDCSFLFGNYTNVVRIDFGESFNTANVTTMYSMFNSCKKLTELDLSTFNTSQVTNMYGMFLWCSSITELDASGFDTSQVTNMSRMFSYCRSLVELNVSGFDTSQVTDMSKMFSGCISLAELDVSGFDTSQVEDMEYMFSSCPKLKSLTLWSDADFSGLR